MRDLSVAIIDYTGENIGYGLVQITCMTSSGLVEVFVILVLSSLAAARVEYRVGVKGNFRISCPRLEKDLLSYGCGRMLFLGVIWYGV